MQLNAIVDIEADTGFIRVTFNKGRMIELPPQLKLALRHATKQQHDVFIVLQKGIENHYVGSAAQGVPQGIWHIELSNTDDETGAQWRLTQRTRLVDATKVVLQAE